MVTRILLVLLIAWTAMTTAAGAESTPDAGSSSATKTTPDQPRPAVTRQGTAEQPSKDDEELIKNLDLIEHLDLLDSVEVLGALSTPDTPEEEF